MKTETGLKNEEREQKMGPKVIKVIKMLKVKPKNISTTPKLSSTSNARHLFFINVAFLLGS